MVKRKAHDCQLRVHERTINKAIKLPAATDLCRLWKGVPIELKLEILSFLPENYLWALRGLYPMLYYNQTVAICNLENEFRILKEASKGYVFRFLQELHLQQKPDFRNITPQNFPKLEILTIGVNRGDFQDLPSHHGLRDIKIRAPCLDLSFLTMTKFPSLDVLALYSMGPVLTSLSLLNITRLSIFCFRLLGFETLTDKKLPKLKVLEIVKRKLDCFNLPVHKGLESFNCECCDYIKNWRCLKTKFPNLQQLRIREGVNCKGLDTEGLEIVVRISTPKLG